MKSETKPDGSKRFGASVKTMGEYFSVFRSVIAWARDEKLIQGLYSVGGSCEKCVRPQRRPSGASAISLPEPEETHLS
jgi:hypothetical protein